ncbi:hypothetical protein [Billgrantia pellis]|nr:hypothetical protein [Halomonas pellis]
MTPTNSRHENRRHRVPSAMAARGVGLVGQYWYWFSSGVPAAES